MKIGKKNFSPNPLINYLQEAVELANVKSNTLIASFVQKFYSLFKFCYFIFKIKGDSYLPQNSNH